MIYVQLLLSMMSGVLITHENGGLLIGVLGVAFAALIGMKEVNPDEEA